MFYPVQAKEGGVRQHAESVERERLEKSTNLIGQCYEHKRVAGPDMEVIWIEEEDGFSVDAPACRHFEFNVFMADVLLLVVHSIGKG